MKLAFSTLGCPGWSWNEIFSTAKGLGLDGIEVRGVGTELFAPKSEPFQGRNIDITRQNLQHSGVKISMLASGSTFGMGDTGRAMQEAKAYVDLAQYMGCKYVRVLTVLTPEPQEGEDLELCRRLYQELCDYSQYKGVMPLIETNGQLGDSRVMAEFMNSIQAENKGVLWDIHHPYRYFHETPEQTYANIGSWIRYLHVKDSVDNEGRVEYRIIGYGDVPVLGCLKLMHRHGYEGYASLEWLKRWRPDLQEPGMVFAHYAGYMQCLMNMLL